MVERPDSSVTTIGCPPIVTEVVCSNPGTTFIFSCPFACYLSIDLLEFVKDRPWVGGPFYAEEDIDSLKGKTSLI